jgi:hypothetical protein
MAVVSSVPALNAVALTVPALPSALVKKPSFRAMRAGACVILLRKPSLTVTGEPPAAFALLVEPEDEEDDEQPASSSAAPIIAAVVTRRI